MLDGGNSVNRRRTLKAIGTSIIGVSLAGCSSSGNGTDNGSGGNGTDNGGNGGATTSQKELTSFPLVTPHFGFWNSTIPYVAGQEKNFFANEGLKVSRVSTEGGGSNIRALVSGDGMACYSTGMAGLFAAYRESAGIRIVSNEFNKSSDMFFYAKADSEYDSADDLAGAKIGFSSPGSSTNMVAATAAEGHEGAEAIAIGGPPSANTALESGEIDLAWAVPPLFMEDINAGKYKIVFRGSDIPPFDALTIRCNFVSKQDLEQNPDLIASYWSAHKKALDWAYNNMDEAIQLWAEARESQNHDILRQSVEQGFPRDAMALNGFKNVDKANEIAREFGFIDTLLSQDEINEVINTDPLPMTSKDTFS